MVSGVFEVGILFGKQKMHYQPQTFYSTWCKDRGGETQAYFDSVTEGRKGFKATWSTDGDKLQVDIAKIKLQYRETLNKAGDTAAGTCSSALTRRLIFRRLIHTKHLLVNPINDLLCSKKFCFVKILLVRNTARAINNFSSKSLP